MELLFIAYQLSPTKSNLFIIIIQDLSKSPIAAEQPTNNINSDAACCDDDDDDVLSDEALEKLDKEVEAASSEENKLGITSTCPVVNGTGEPVVSHS